MRKAKAPTKGNPKKLNPEFLIKLNERLINSFGKRSVTKEKGLLWSLIKGLLSQNTSDKNRDIAFENLQKNVGSVEELSKLELSQIASLIRPAGLSSIRASRIKKLLLTVKEDDLKALKDAPLADALSYLTSIDGVGAKTAAVFLLFNFGMPVFPVDTHIKRVLRRIGMFPYENDAAKMQKELSNYVPQGIHLDLHLNIIELGRKYCKANSPKCGICPIEDLCEKVI